MPSTLGATAGSIAIGSGLVTDAWILGRGRNQRVQRGSATLHAEMDCLENAGRLTAADHARATLYSMLEPFDMCGGAATSSGLVAISFRAEQAAPPERPEGSYLERVDSRPSCSTPASSTIGRGAASGEVRLFGG